MNGGCKTRSGVTPERLRSAHIVRMACRVQAGLADASFAQKRQLVELLIDRVVVTEDEVAIRYVVPTSSRGEHTRFCHLR